MTLDTDETERVLRIRLALTLHKTPVEIDEMPLLDTADLLEVMRADNAAKG